MSGKKFLTEKHRRRMKKQRENRKLRLPEMVESTPAEVETMIAEAKMAPAQVICPLCQKPITVEEAMNKNVDNVIYNRKPVQVHKACPMEVK